MRLNINDLIGCLCDSGDGDLDQRKAKCRQVERGPI